MSRAPLRSWMPLAVAGALSLGASPAGPPPAAPWASRFDTDPSHLTSVGRNDYFVLEPGFFRVLRGGYRHYQEQAPGVAMDRCEILSASETVTTPAGVFRNCLRVADTSPMIKGMREIKYFAPGIGLVRVESLALVEHGYRNSSR